MECSPTTAGMSSFLRLQDSKVFRGPGPSRGNLEAFRGSYYPAAVHLNGMLSQVQLLTSSELVKIFSPGLSSEGKTRTIGRASEELERK